MLALGRAMGETMAVTMIIGNSTSFNLSWFAPGNTIADCIAKLDAINNETNTANTTMNQNVDDLSLDQYKGNVVTNFAEIFATLGKLKANLNVIQLAEQELYADKLIETIGQFIVFIGLAQDKLKYLQTIRQNTLAKRIGSAAGQAYDAASNAVHAASSILPNQMAEITIGPIQGGRLPKFTTGGSLDYEKIDAENEEVIRLFIANYNDLKDRIVDMKNKLNLSLLISFTKEASHYFEITIDVTQLMIDNYQPPPTFFERTSKILSAIKIFPEKKLDEIVETVENNTCKDENPDPTNPYLRAIGKFDGKCLFIDISMNKIK
jgi:hypothetical protein